MVRVEQSGQLAVSPQISLILLTNNLSRTRLRIRWRHAIRGPNSNDARTTRRLDVALDTFESSLAELISTFETGGLDQLYATEKVAEWQRFETLATDSR